MKLVIVVPTYNERRNIEELVPQLFEHVPSAEVLVADDNSPDGTADAVVALQKRYPRLRLLKRPGKQGLGKAYAHAFQEVLADPSVDAVIMMDADLSHAPRYIPDMLRKLAGADVVVGSRYVDGAGTSGWELWRRVLSRGANIYCRTITGLPIKDCTGGFNVMSATVMRSMDLNSLDLSGYAFIQELKYALFKAGGRFAEHPIIFKNRKEGESKMSSHIIREGVIAPWKVRFKR